MEGLFPVRCRVAKNDPFCSERRTRHCGLCLGERPHFALYPGSMLEDQAALLTVSVPVLPFEVPERVSRLLGLEAAAKATLSHR